MVKYEYRTGSVRYSIIGRFRFRFRFRFNPHTLFQLSTWVLRGPGARVASTPLHTPTLSILTCHPARLTSLP